MWSKDKLQLKKKIQLHFLYFYCIAVYCFLADSCSFTTHGNRLSLPKGCRSSSLVLSRFTKTVVTPCSGKACEISKNFKDDSMNLHHNIPIGLKRSVSVISWFLWQYFVLNAVRVEVVYFYLTTIIIYLRSAYCGTKNISVHSCGSLQIWNLTKAGIRQLIINWLTIPMIIRLQLLDEKCGTNKNFYISTKVMNQRIRWRL